MGIELTLSDGRVPVCVWTRDIEQNAIDQLRLLVTVVTTQRIGLPLHKVDLARGSSHLVAISDESRIDVASEPWSRLGRQARFAHLDLPLCESVYHYRLVASIVMAEISRQVGTRLPGGREAHRGQLTYDRALVRAAETAGELVTLADLIHY